MDNNIVVGVDIGGSHITASCVDLSTGCLIAASLTRHPVQSKGDVDLIIEQWTDAIAKCKACVPGVSNRIGIAMPGPFDYQNGISLIKGLDKYEALYNLNIKALLARELKINKQDILMMNDASCYLKGEIFNGTAGLSKRVLGVTLGTGLGSAVCIDDVFYDGDMYSYLYRSATAEDYLSARWFVAKYQDLTGIEANNVKEIKDQIGTDSRILSFFKDFGQSLGEVLLAYIKKYNIEVVIIGGNLIKAWDLFIEETEYVLTNHSLKVQLLKSRLGEEAAIIGAGSLFEKLPIRP